MKCATTQTEIQTGQTTENTEVEWMKERLVQQDEKLNIIMATISQYSTDTQTSRETANDGYAGPHSSKNNGGSWVEVVNKKGKAIKDKYPAADPPPSKLSEARRVMKEASRHSVRIRPAAFVIDAASEGDFPALTRKIKSGISVGNNINEKDKGRQSTSRGAWRSGCSELGEIRGISCSRNQCKCQIVATAYNAGK
jgi:hypothetical protein